VCSPANTKENTVGSREEVNVMIENREEEKIEMKKVETVNQEEKCYEVCISDIMMVLKQEILGQMKEEKGISSGFHKAIEEMEESGMTENTFIKNMSFRYRGSVMCEGTLSFYRSVSVEDSKESVRELEKQLSGDFWREGMMVCGFPELLRMVLEKESKE